MLIFIIFFFNIFFYFIHNIPNTDKVKKGTVSLSQEINRVIPPLTEKEKRDLIAKCQNFKILCTDKIVKDIDQKSKVILERFVAGDTKNKYYTVISKDSHQFKNKPEKQTCLVIIYLYN